MTHRHETENIRDKANNTLRESHYHTIHDSSYQSEQLNTSMVLFAFCDKGNSEESCNWNTELVDTT